MEGEKMVAHILVFQGEDVVGDQDTILEVTNHYKNGDTEISIPLPGGKRHCYIRLNLPSVVAAVMKSDGTEEEE